MSTPRDTPPRASVLMVDDRPENLVALEAILEPLGHELVRAGSGPEALRQVLTRDFAVLLLDVQMPEMNGFELAHLIKARERSRHIPIIFLTAISKDEAYVFEGYSVGAVDYMFKPFHPDILRSKVSVLVDLYLKGEEVRRQAELLRQSEVRELELKHRTRLLESEARFAAIVSSAMDAIVSFGDDRRVTLFNAAAERVFRCSADDAVGEPVDRWFLGEIPVPTEADGGGSVSLGGTRETMGVRKNGDEFPAELTVSTVRLEGETAYTLIVRDVSERRRAEEALRAQAVSLAQTTDELRRLNEELNERTAELEHAVGVRSRFYASMSHELRTPINAVLGYTSLLLDDIYGPLTPEQSRSIERTNRAGRHLLDLVNDILDLSKIEAGKMELLLETVSFPELIEDLFITIAPLADDRGVELRLTGEEEPCGVVSDGRRVRQILLNLLSNAVKFGEGKPVVVDWRRADGSVVVEITDNGPGIPPEDQESVFMEFVQLKEEHQGEGTGLGLAISRRLAELLGGSLTLSSVVGEGSSFRLTLPASISPEQARGRIVEPAAHG